MNAPAIRATDERFTPAWLIALVVEALGPVAYDPCAPPHNPVGAREFSALPENGLEQPWQQRSGDGLVYVNPPFSNGNLHRWSNVVCCRAELGCEIVMLTPVDPSTAWYSLLAAQAAVAAPLRKRVKYVTPSDQAQMKSVAMQPSMLWYFGARTRAFLRVFTEQAHCFLPGVV